MSFKFGWKGCLIGCGSVIVLLMILVISAGYWATKKGDFEADSTILNASSDFYFRAHLQAEDQLLIDFLSTQVKEMSQLNPMYEKYPDFFRSWQEGKARKDLTKMLPLEVELTGQMAEDDFRASVGFSLYNNLAKIAFWGVKRAAAKNDGLRDYAGTPYVAVEEDETFCFTLWNNIVYFSKTEAGMEGMIDGLNLAAPAEDQRLLGVDLQAPVYGFLVGTTIRTALGEIIDTPTDAETAQLDALAENITHIGFDLTLTDTQTMTGRISLDMPQSEELRDGLQQLLEDQAAKEELQFSFEISETESGYQVTYKVSGFTEVLKGLEDQLN